MSLATAGSVDREFSFDVITEILLQDWSESRG